MSGIQTTGPPKRPRTQPITRVRTGCFTCRRRKKRCDETKPVCGGCVRNKLNCEWPASVCVDRAATSRLRGVFQDRSSQTIEQVPQYDSASSLVQSFGDSSSSVRSEELSPHGTTENFVSSPTPTGPEEPPYQLQESSCTSQELEVRTRRPPAEEEECIPRQLSLLPGYDEESFQLLNHYLATTADCMANGSTPINPFLVQIVPLAFSSDLLLQLVLTQSAAHRAFRRRDESDTVAQNHYGKALQRFRKGVTEFIEGKESNSLLLTVGALLMCFTETAKGDMNGAIFDHLTAANSLLLRLLSQSDAAVPKDLKEFVIEYYTYTASVSMISIDARASPQLLLDLDLEQRARELLTREYVGNLCGCWLELLLLVPCIFELGRQWMTSDGVPKMPTADDLAMFASIQGQILRWSPYPSVTPDVFQAGRIFQQAMLIYLFTSLNCFNRLENGMHQSMIDTATIAAMSYLDQLSPTARINSGLCWPIAVVGSCLNDPMQQETLRHRLNVMVDTFGLGNMQRTLLLLEHMWEMPRNECGPWNISLAMQRNQIWISFA
ncbi:hypothetical protein ASPZODRAFT_137783 [Penicilliopsis zonata CBS 506.65]|uniref:Zn(2)-C6 fungal-type domain-containing protein n=1 Tax=Penicilliopsis zonata CBS 506.65 TaxID=1073090 RepID=A0A1L9STV1_9EURO|nr:hypothetical protein ASPZODRAFT_137783 [Penicilliopsis zonata CBS 506.65]OJJ50628.1 hypothetical protein ASPZODRAFT_137783 [Penicilliopsis zonata CBS 506.65]